MGKKTYNPEKRAWKGKSYKKGASGWTPSPWGAPRTSPATMSLCRAQLVGAKAPLSDSLGIDDDNTPTLIMLSIEGAPASLTLDVKLLYNLLAERASTDA